MPGKNEPLLENQEPTNEETEEEKKEEERAERYEDRVMEAIIGVMSSEAEE